VLVSLINILSNGRKHQVAIPITSNDAQSMSPVRTKLAGYRTQRDVVPTIICFEAVDQSGRHMMLKNSRLKVDTEDARNHSFAQRITSFRETVGSIVPTRKGAVGTAHNEQPRRVLVGHLVASTPSTRRT
jgi:hypothetical protein